MQTRFMFPLAALVILMVSLLAQVARADLPALYSVTGVATNDVLNLREGPSASTPILGMLAPEATGIEAVARQGNWLLVNAGETSGWASATYLEPHPGAQYPGHTRMVCFGTEPFWSVRFEPGDAAGLSILGQGGPDTRWFEMSRVFGGNGGQDPNVLTGTGTAGQLTIAMARQSCSDGMSDAVFGVAGTVVLNHETGPWVGNGCCSLRP